VLALSPFNLTPGFSVLTGDPYSSLVRDSAHMFHPFTKLLWFGGFLRTNGEIGAIGPGYCASVAS
jgi:hypothetical protein